MKNDFRHPLRVANDRLTEEVGRLKAMLDGVTKERDALALMAIRGDALVDRLTDVIDVMGSLLTSKESPGPDRADELRRVFAAAHDAMQEESI